MEATCSIETWVLIRVTRRHITEDGILHALLCVAVCCRSLYLSQISESGGFCRCYGAQNKLPLEIK
jgi:hypothetical protein